MLTARVHGNMTERNWIDLRIDGHYVASILGKAKVKYTLEQTPSSKYMITVGNIDAFLHVDGIEAEKC